MNPEMNNLRKRKKIIRPEWLWWEKFRRWWRDTWPRSSNANRSLTACPSSGDERCLRHRSLCSEYLILPFGRSLLRCNIRQLALYQTVAKRFWHLSLD